MQLVDLLRRRLRHLLHGNRPPKEHRDIHAARQRQPKAPPVDENGGLRLARERLHDAERIEPRAKDGRVAHRVCAAQSRIWDASAAITGRCRGCEFERHRSAQAGRIGTPVRSASFARPLRLLRYTTSSASLVLKMPAMPSGTMPTHVPAAVVLAIDLPRRRGDRRVKTVDMGMRTSHRAVRLQLVKHLPLTSTAPKRVMYRRKGVWKTTDAGAPTKGRKQNVLMPGMESRLASGRTPWGGPAPYHAGDACDAASSSLLHTNL
eukprot:6051871-Prymnesium_polylepis.1